MDNKGMGSCITGELEGAWPHVTAAGRRKKGASGALSQRTIFLQSGLAAMGAILVCGKRPAPTVRPRLGNPPSHAPAPPQESLRWLSLPMELSSHFSRTTSR